MKAPSVIPAFVALTIASTVAELLLPGCAPIGTHPHPAPSRIHDGGVPQEDPLPLHWVAGNLAKSVVHGEVIESSAVCEPEELAMQINCVSESFALTEVRRLQVNQSAVCRWQNGAQPEPNDPDGYTVEQSGRAWVLCMTKPR